MYLTVSTCKQLEKLGLKSESGMWWYKGDSPLTMGDDYEIVSGQAVAYYELDAIMAFTPFDIIANKENAVRLWGEDWNIDFFAPGTPPYKSYSHQLLDVMLSGGDFEAELIKLLNNKE